ncbi:hypothetical protein [Flavobacterium degerlachei]|jgi:hypothetical protein|uniref:Uncharacterized protein n=1 Tax=Flavobacterium degerlachei TaxID=229203 RepID=A0A1H3B3G3_9FLAO|nr:hypothetical protein [Flavobacterium degerlachei]SDX36472.1 hypothetical protein SAMN05444338_109145 [Flavobacterium degerlachei]
MFKKPNSKTVTNVAIQGGSMVLGAKVGDGLATLAPDSMSSYKRIILGVVGIGLAACIPATSTANTIAQSASLGMGVKQLYDEITDTIANAVPVKEAVEGASLTATDKFVNALVGHKEPMLASLNGSWGNDLIDESIWDRPLQQALSSGFTGV